MTEQEQNQQYEDIFGKDVHDKDLEFIEATARLSNFQDILRNVNHLVMTHHYYNVHEYLDPWKSWELTKTDSKLSRRLTERIKFRVMTGNTELIEESELHILIEAEETTLNNWNRENGKSYLMTGFGTYEISGVNSDWWVQCNGRSFCCTPVDRILLMRKELIS